MIFENIIKSYNYSRQKFLKEKYCWQLILNIFLKHKQLLTGILYS